MSPKTGEEKAVNLGFVIITFRTRSENPLLSNGGRRIMFVRLSEIRRKNAHSTTPRKKKNRNKPKLLLVLPTVARVIITCWRKIIKKCTKSCVVRKSSIEFKIMATANEPFQSKCTFVSLLKFFLECIVLFF